MSTLDAPGSDGSGVFVRRRSSGDYLRGDYLTFAYEPALQLRKGDLVRVVQDFETARGNVQMVKKARRNRQDFKVGQVITSDTLREVMWVRGMVIESEDSNAAFVLREDGKWHDLLGPSRDCECSSGWPFESFERDYRIVRLP